MMKKDKEQKTVQRQKSNSMMNPIKGFADGMKKMTDSMAATLKVPMSPKHKHDDDVKANTASMVTDRTVMFADSDHMSEEEQLTKLEAFSGALKEAFLCVPKSTVKVFHRIGNIEGKVYKKVKGIFVETDDTERSVKDSEHHAAHTDFPVVPPDEKVAEMDIVISKKMKGVSIPDYYSTTWAETTPFYANWLEASGKMDVSVGDWQEGEVQGEWCREIYQRQRIITFHFQRTTPLYKGSLNANVKHTQYCRVEGSDRCVLSMTVQMEGIPYADFFSVEVRWVATRVGSKDIQLEVGLFVNFVTSTV
jgi:VAD1 Analog of StAR-related lipid transfer domain